ncbi:TonB-dependent hemoglobin/transferrin/lactoferrin family receptor [Rhizobium sp. 'Codium 1']|uniref:TonB-dependent hemoglobin/transferrin/lactoferrin family receptor n=1 Tax=Rhizobium sp. 'Codium 1' TaxID=2940484 RepID=UPI001E2CCBCD|nr:TonB-dependent hemoglobin/transferrin/lactoferrin family receptor [Rhizobium sp. 'Codium 1']MCC8932177.1 TonB-dependent hemoglobin/transferrin/lactoferrin family receptor [Rhizobium sp. 'Codium 1']
MGSRPLRPLLLACTALVAVSAILPAHAQDATTASQDETQLETIVVKGKRVPAGSVADTPLATQTTAEEIRKKEIKDLSDLGNTTEAGIDFIKAKPGRTGGLFIRGLTGARVAVLVDEIPVPFLQTIARNGSSSPTTGINGQPDSFDVDSLGGLDVLRGADSSKVGSGALGGALAARTLEPEDLIGEGRDWGGVAKTGYDSEDKSFSNSVAVAKQVENTSVLFQGSYTRGHETDNQGNADIYGTSRTEPNPMDFVRNNLLFKFRHKLEGGHTVGMTAERYDYTSESNLKTLQSSAFTAGTAATTFRPDAYFGWDDVRRERVSLDYFYDAPSSDTLVQAASLRLYWQQLSKDAGSSGLRNSGAQYLRANEAQEDDFGVIGSMVSEFDTGTLRHQLRLRGNATMFETHQFIAAFPASATVVSQSDAPDVDGVTLGFSIEDQITLGDSGFSITPGIRFDFHDYEPQDSAAYRGNTGYNAFGLPESFSDSKFSPKLLAEYQLNESVGVFAQWAMAYRAPTVDELYGNFTNTLGGYASIGNPNLEAETGNGFEVGAKWNTGDFNGSVTLFHNMYDNFINNVTRVGVSPQPTSLFTYENVQDARISGAEIKARKDFANGFFAEGSLAVAYGEYGDNNTRIRSVAPLKAILGLGYEQETWGTQLTGIFSAAMPDDSVANTYDAPGYGIFNVTGWWEPEAVKGLRIQAGVNNIFDKTYWNAVGVASVNPNSASSGNQPVAFYSEAGTTFKISLTQKF